MEQKRKSGILVHPVSFPSIHGIGDLGEKAYQFIDFLKRSNQKLWQILPLGPTSYGDSPYQSYSAFAGNELLISLDLLKEENLLDDEDLKDIPDFSKTKIEYEKVITFKKKFLKKAFLNFKEDNQYKKFCKTNNFWLDNYSLFCAIKANFINKRKGDLESGEFLNFIKISSGNLSEQLQKDYYYGGVWITWPSELVQRNRTAISNVRKELKEDIDFVKFQQYTFFKQWSDIKDYSNKNGIEIIGDTPIFVSYDSADVWANPRLFNLDEKGLPIGVAGVPPDYFSESGQLWGNPLYKWEEHKRDGYFWWFSRIKHQLKTCDLIRIDHFRGFESYYSIPFGSADAKNGTWIKGCGRDFFKNMKKELRDIPIIAEDLGIITKQVTSLRNAFNLPGMKVLQFAFDDSENNAYLPHNYEKNTVVYTGTHDNDTTIGWFMGASEREKDNFRRYMNTGATSPGWDLIRLALASAANFAIYPLQDVLCLDGESRMNTPGSTEGNWQWRYESCDLLNTHAENLTYLTKLFKR